MVKYMSENNHDTNEDYPPLQITFDGIEHSEAIEKIIRSKANNIGKFYERISICRVTIEAPHNHHHKGKLYNVKVVMHLPGRTISSNRNPELHQSHEDIYVAIRDAFKETKRQLQDYIHRKRIIKRIRYSEDDKT